MFVIIVASPTELGPGSNFFHWRYYNATVGSCMRFAVWNLGTERPHSLYSQQKDFTKTWTDVVRSWQ